MGRCYLRRPGPYHNTTHFEVRVKHASDGCQPTPHPHWPALPPPLPCCHALRVRHSEGLAPVLGTSRCLCHTPFVSTGEADPGGMLAQGRRGLLCRTPLGGLSILPPLHRGAVTPKRLRLTRGGVRLAPALCPDLTALSLFPQAPYCPRHVRIPLKRDANSRSPSRPSATSVQESIHSFRPPHQLYHPRTVPCGPCPYPPPPQSTARPVASPSPTPWTLPSHCSAFACCLLCPVLYGDALCSVWCLVCRWNGWLFVSPDGSQGPYMFRYLCTFDPEAFSCQPGRGLPSLLRPHFAVMYILPTGTLLSGLIR
eukprot:EG_transcript_13193